MFVSVFFLDFSHIFNKKILKQVIHKTSKKSMPNCILAFLLGLPLTEKLREIRKFNMWKWDIVPAYLLQVWTDGF